MKRTKNKKKRKTPLSEQVISSSRKKAKKIPKYDGNIEKTTSTGSTLLDLAISGGRKRGGGIPSGIIVELFGPPGSGKTVVLCEMAGIMQRKGGQVMFLDPEARLDMQFSKMLGFEADKKLYDMPDTVPELFNHVRTWNPEPVDAQHGIFADSLSALSTEMELSDKGDKRGQRRAKEFSEETRKTCRILKKKNLLMACSNQVRENPDAGPYGQKYTTSGGNALPHYASLRLRFFKAKNSKIKKKKKIKGNEEQRTVGIRSMVEVYKSSVWKPYLVAPMSVLFDYGIDDIRENLQFVKRYSSESVYTVGSRLLDKSIDGSIKIIEEEGLQNELREEVIDLWEEIESKFESRREPKRK